MSNTSFQKDLTSGHVAKQLLLFSLPFLLANLLQALYNMADMLIVGQFSGAVGASAVGVGGQVTILVINLVGGLAVGGTVMIAQFIGARRQREMERTVSTMFTLYLAAGAVLTVVMLLLGPSVLHLMKVSEEAYADTLAYLDICMGGTLFVVAYNAIAAVLRGMGDSRHPLIFVAISAAVNVGLDLLLVGVFDMGAAGAAWATIAAQALSVVISVIFLRRRKFVFDFRPRSFRIDRVLAGQLIRLGIPSSLQGTLVCLSFMVLTGVANVAAPTALIGSTALSIAGKINSVAILPSLAMQASVASMGGQNIGAGKPKRALQTMSWAMGMAFAFSLVIFVVVQSFPGQLVDLFIGKADPAIRAGTVEYLRILCVDYLFTSLLFCINGLAIGAGHTLFSLINGCVSSLLVRIPVAYLFGITLGMGLRGVALAAPSASVVSLAIGVGYLLVGKWKTARVTAPDGTDAAGEQE